MELLIRGGTVVTASGSFEADVAVDNGKITAIGKDLPVTADQIVDASGRLVLPGALDAHTHMAMPFGGTVSRGQLPVRYKSCCLRRSDYNF